MDDKLSDGKGDENSGQGRKIRMEKCRKRSAAGFGIGTNNLPSMYK